MKNLLINRALAAKTTKLFTLLLAVAASVGTLFAEKVQIGDLYYNLDATNQTAEVTSQNSSYPYWSTSITTANIPASVEYNSLTYSVTSIGKYAFYNCSGMTSVTIPNSVTSIGGSAFYGCSGLTSPIYNTHVFAKMPQSYSGAYTIPDDIESIASGAFYDCSSLTSVTIPNTVTSIGNEAFADCIGLTAIDVAADNPNYCSEEGVLFNRDKTTLVAYPTGKQGSNYTIPNSVTSIGEYAFSGCSSLTSVPIPGSVTSIEDYAFAGCSGLTSVTIPNSVTSIEWAAFSSCSSLTSVTIGNSVTSIGYWAFSSCSGLTSVTIPNSVTSIGAGAFSSCSGLTSVTIGNSVTSIGEWAFMNCTGLTSVTIEADTPPTIGIYCFYSGDYNNNHFPLNISIYVPCGSLDTYKTAEGWSDYAYRIKYAPLPYKISTQAENGSVTTTDVATLTICDEPFITCTATPDYGYHFTQWSDGNTDNPRTIVLTQDTTMEAIFDYLLEGKCGKDSALTWTFEPASMALNISGKGALSENYTYGTFIESLTIGNEITSIGKWAFGECNNLKNVIMGSSVKVLEEYAFYRCSAIETITCYGQRPPTVNQNALYGLDYSTIIYVPADYLETYKMHDAWGLYDVRPLGAKSTETTDVNVTPAENTADVAWPIVSGAATYELVIKDKSGNVICTLIFNANGQLTSIAFAPSRNGAPQQAQAAGFSFTVTGLEEGTSYDLTITSKDNNGGTLDTKTVSFTTTGEAQGLEDVQSDNVQGTKVLINGKIFILRGEKVYTLQGQEVK